MAFDHKKYAQELIDAAGAMTDVERQAVEKLFSADAVAKRVAQEQTERMMQSDYNRNMDKLTADKQEWQDFYQKTVTWKAQEADRIARLEALAAQANGHDPNGNQNGVNQTVLTTEALTALDKKYDERMKSQEQNFLSLLEGVGDITSDYVVRFKEKPDLGAIKKIAIDKGMSLTQAYNEYIAPRLQTMQQADFEAKIKAAREEGAKDALSKQGLPGITAARDFHPLLDRGVSDQNVPEKGPARDRWIREQFVQDLNSPSATSGGTTG
jgi:hypothetical protein